MIHVWLNRQTRGRRAVTLALLIVLLFDIVWGPGDGCDCSALRQRQAAAAAHATP